MKSILPFNIDINYELLKDFVECNKSKFKTYVDYRPIQGAKWKIYKTDTCEYGQEILKKLQLKGNPRFYILLANTTLDPHVDLGTQCSVNFLINEKNAPITIEGKDYWYKNALINTSRIHSVNNNTNTDRYIFKISIFDQTFDQVCKHFYELQKKSILQILD